MKPRDLRGRKFGLLTAIEPGFKSLNGSTTWRCVCECGSSKTILTHNLNSGSTRSCGCLQKQRASKSNTRHGYSKYAEFDIWRLMIDRCENKLSSCYDRYGGRGIRVSAEWIDSFETFLNDMGLRPSINHSIERIDNNGGYSAINCRWATNYEQSRNKRNNRMITMNGRTKCLKDWSIETGIRSDTARARINKGWPEWAALTLPIFSRYKNE